jgi:hypothetical protein
MAQEEPDAQERHYRTTDQVAHRAQQELQLQARVPEEACRADGCGEGKEKPEVRPQESQARGLVAGYFRQLIYVISFTSLVVKAIMDEKVITAFFALIALIGLVFIYMGLTQGNAMAASGTARASGFQSSGTGLTQLGLRVATGSQSGRSSRYSSGS